MGERIVFSLGPHFVKREFSPQTGEKIGGESGLKMRNCPSVPLPPTHWFPFSFLIS